MSEVLTQATHMLSLPGAASFIDRHGREHHLLVLTCKRDGALQYVGLGVLEAAERRRPDAEAVLISAAVADQLLGA